MRKLFSGRVRGARGWGTPPTLPSAVGSSALPSLEDVADRVLAGAGSRLADEAKQAVRDIVAGEAVALQQASGAIEGGGLAARRRARAIGEWTAGADQAVAQWQRELRALLGKMTVTLPATSDDDAMLRVEVALIELVDRPAQLLTDIIGSVLAWLPGEPGAVRLGSHLAAAVKGNLLAVSGLSEDEAGKRPQRLLWPTEAKGNPRELVERYLGDTPLASLLLSPVPFMVGRGSFIESGWVLAKPGAGKTQTLELIVDTLLTAAAAAPQRMASVIIVDSQGEMLQRIGRLACFGPRGALRDRLIYIDPRERPIALNPFALRRDRMAGYSVAMCEQITNGTIELLEFLFGSVLGAELTQKQGVIFRYLVRLLMAIPGANITTLRDVLEEPERFAADMQRLDGSARHFFERQFFARDYAATRSQILRRLWGIFEQPTFERMLSVPDNKLDFFDKLQAGHVILVNTAKDFLKEERSRVLARLVVAMTMQAVFERAAVPKGQRRPTFLIIDEAHEVLDDNARRMFEQSRKYACGTICANQLLEQLPRGLRKALAMSTVKLVGRVIADDAADMAADLGTAPATLLGLRKVEMVGAEFVLAVANRTTSALTVRLPFGAIDRRATMSEAEWRQLLIRNAERYGAAWQMPALSSLARPRAAANDDDDGWFG